MREEETFKFWDIMESSILEIHRRFGGTYYTHFSVEVESKSEGSMKNIVTYRAVARQRPRNKQRDEYSVYRRCFVTGD
jgi:hypothetical protein